MRIQLQKKGRASLQQFQADLPIQFSMQRRKSSILAGVCMALLGFSTQLAAHNVSSEKSSAHKIDRKADPALGDMVAIQQSANDAQLGCYESMHDDADEYTSCLNALLAAVKGKSSVAKQQRLGIAYFAWVGAANSARLSMPGAEQAAQFYLPKFRVLQKQLKLSDEALCTTIAGDCKARLAQIAQMEKELQEAKVRQVASSSAKAQAASAKLKDSK